MDYFTSVLLAGVLQIVLSLLGVAKLMRFVPRSVVVGFVHALAILVFTSQFRTWSACRDWSTRCSVSVSR